jgi:hypothetical protein
MNSGMGRSILEIISKTTSIEPRVKISHHISDRSYCHLCYRAAVSHFSGNRSELVFFFSFSFNKRYIPPIIDPDDPEIRNSDNTVLFLFSCYQYIMIAIILSVGPPYRQPMIQNGTISSITNLICSPIHGDDCYYSIIHHYNGFISAIMASIGLGINAYEYIIRIPPGSNCLGKFYH